MWILPLNLRINSKWANVEMTNYVTEPDVVPHRRDLALCMLPVRQRTQTHGYSESKCEGVTRRKRQVYTNGCRDAAIIILPIIRFQYPAPCVCVWASMQFLSLFGNAARSIPQSGSNSDRWGGGKDSLRYNQYILHLLSEVNSHPNQRPPASLH